jgi:hypothetical protein
LAQGANWRERGRWRVMVSWALRSSSSRARCSRSWQIQDFFTWKRSGSRRRGDCLKRRALGHAQVWHDPSIYPPRSSARAARCHMQVRAAVLEGWDVVRRHVAQPQRQVSTEEARQRLHRLLLFQLVRRRGGMPATRFLITQSNPHFSLKAICEALLLTVRR